MAQIESRTAAEILQDLNSTPATDEARAAQLADELVQTFPTSTQTDQEQWTRAARS